MDKPTPVSELATEFQDCLTRPNLWADRQDINWKSRYNIWAGQDWSGRKLKARLGKEPFPWDEASDARVPLIDGYINEDVDTLMNALYSARLMAAPTEANDMAKANTVTNFVRWMFYTQMPELEREAELLGNYMLERGLGVLGIFWRREKLLQQQTVRLDQIKPEIAEVIADPTREDEAVELAQQAVEDLGKAELRKAVVALRETGEATYNQPYLCENRPTVVALCPGEDFFVPRDVTELQKARMLFYREFMTKSQLEDAETAYDWDPKWVKKIAEIAKGKAQALSYSTSRVVDSRERQTVTGLDTTELYEIIHCFEKRSGPDHVPGIYYTVFNAHVTSVDGVTDFAARRELLEDAHGQYPFVAFPRERVNRRLDSSRGYGEVGYTMQAQVKTVWDSRSDRESIATIPPLLHPAGRAPSRWGPAVRVPYIRPNEFQFADMPKYDPGNAMVEESVRHMADWYFGRSVKDRDPDYPRSRKQRLVTRWLKGWSEVVQMCFQLEQQHGPDEIWYRVVGSAKAQPLRASRAEIQGKFDLHMSWNVLNQDPELLQAKLDLLLKLLGADVNGVVDRTELMTVIFEYLDPNLGERLLQPMEAASMREIEDEKTVFARMMTGQEENVKPDGQAYKLRMDVLQGLLKTNPLAQQAYNGNERIKEVVDKRMKQLTFQVQQRTVNPMIGRLGA